MTAEMQHLPQRFGDVLVIDATYKTNLHHMPLHSAMIINAENNDNGDEEKSNNKGDTNEIKAETKNCTSLSH